LARSEVIGTECRAAGTARDLTRKKLYLKQKNLK